MDYYTKVRIREALASPTTPYWMSPVLQTMLTNDPAEMANGLEWLAYLAGNLAEEALDSTGGK